MDTARGNRNAARRKPPETAKAVPAARPERVKIPRSLGFMVRRLQQVFVANFHQTLEPFGITPVQYTLLSIVRANPALDQISIAAEAVLDPSTVADVVRRLTDRGLMQREPGATDKRTRTVSLTPRGEQILAQAEVLIQKARKELLSPLSKAEIEQFLGILDRLLVAHEKDSLPWSRSRGQRKQA